MKRSIVYVACLTKLVQWFFCSVSMWGSRGSMSITFAFNSLGLHREHFSSRFSVFPDNFTWIHKKKSSKNIKNEKIWSRSKFEKKWADFFGNFEKFRNFSLKFVWKWKKLRSKIFEIFRSQKFRKFSLKILWKWKKMRSKKIEIFRSQKISDDNFKLLQLWF